jgi:hypothetical protein
VHKRQAGSIKALLDAGAPVDQRDEQRGISFSYKKRAACRENSPKSSAGSFSFD